MGAVYRAFDSRANREVALKVSLAEEVSSQKRLDREGQLTAALNHPGIVRVYSAGSIAGRNYLVYELIEGARPLADELPRLERAERLELVLQVARALAHAHSKGIVHRDLKPENVLLDADGCARVADFGLARANWGELERLTKSGAWVGTPHYLAPEVVTGKATSVGPSVDVWALGVMLYQALTLELPFSGDTMTELAASILSGRPSPPSAVAAEVSPGLEAVCERALQVDPASRYPEAGAFADDLALALANHRPRALVLSQKRQRGRWLVALGALTLLAAAVGAAADWDRSRDAQAAAQAGAKAEERREAARRRELEREQAGAPLREWEAAQALEARHPSRALRALERWLEEHAADPLATKVRARAESLASRAPLWRCEGISAKGVPGGAYLRDGGLVILDGVGQLGPWRAPAGERFAPRDVLGDGVTASPRRRNGTFVLEGLGGALLLGFVAGAHKQAYTLAPNGARHPALPPGRIPQCGAVAANAPVGVVGCSDGSLFVVDLRTGAARELPDAHAHRVVAVALSPDGRSLVSFAGPDAQDLFGNPAWETNRVRIHDVGEGRLRGPERRCRGHARAAAFLDGDTLLYGAEPISVVAQRLDAPDWTAGRLFQPLRLPGVVQDASRLYSLVVGRERVFAVCLGPGSSEPQLEPGETREGVWAAPRDGSRPFERIWLREGDPVLSLQLSPDGTKALCVGNGFAEVWRVPSR
jgi:hypothetical protein